MTAPNTATARMITSPRVRLKGLIALVGLLTGLLWVTTGAAQVPDGLTALELGTVSEVVDGDTVVLADGREIRLVGIQAPKLPLGRKNFIAWPMGEEAKAALAALTLGQRVTPATGGAAMDRHGRHLAHLYLDDGTWVQGRLLASGFARVYSFPDNRAEVDAMLVHERAARAAKRGIWEHGFYALRAATMDALNPLIGTFQVIEGRVVDAANVKGRLYLNFGADWRTDFTISLDRQALKLFPETQRKADAWKGATLRVRGWLKDRNGPMIEATHPEQIERVD